MKTQTYEQRLKEAADKAKTRVEYDTAVEEIVEEMKQTDEQLYNIEKRWCNYGTWRVTLWVNEYLFGSELKEYIADHLSIITHDEEREWKTLADIEEEFYDCVTDYAFFLF